MNELTLDLARWARAPDDTDTRVLDRCLGPALDVGCGPGRMVVALARRGVPALGIDVAPEAVQHVLNAGGLALVRSVFKHVPGEGRWQHAILLDGCIGIGGSPIALLKRVRELLAPGGVAYVEHDTSPDRADLTTARISDGRGRVSAPFAWAVIGHNALDRAAQQAGLRVLETWPPSDRALCVLQRPAEVS
ncbi:class I SAM-dependent methyltransferase [Tenggerimyces flavus]|uniref:Class I SAM-dependent methyltransferase n=1 Tax=Tenggerimyces flavus TaxID=1708749 RepID=A0ABV7YMG2_9ACTN|nr:methyltransferase domain-containing protein [Tenggerimyces flavus]MBM7785788.1 SAM-dependent methyltransferase [Tenggerimyces flavus]